jgi:hypothetical protein
MLFKQGQAIREQGERTKQPRYHTFSWAKGNFFKAHLMRTKFVAAMANIKGTTTWRNFKRSPLQAVNDVEGPTASGEFCSPTMIIRIASANEPRKLDLNRLVKSIDVKNH